MEVKNTRLIMTLNNVKLYEETLNDYSTQYVINIHNKVELFPLNKKHAYELFRSVADESVTINTIDG